MPAIPEFPPISSHLAQRSTAGGSAGPIYLWRVIGKSADDVELTCEGLTMSRVRVSYDVLAEDFVAIVIPRTAIVDAIAADPTLSRVHTGAPDGTAARLEAALSADEELRARLGEMTKARDGAVSRAAHLESALTQATEERDEINQLYKTAAAERDAAHQRIAGLEVDLEQAVIDRKAAVDRYTEARQTIDDKQTEIDNLTIAHESSLEQNSRVRLMLLRRLVHEFADAVDSKHVSRMLHGYLSEATEPIDVVRKTLQSHTNGADTCHDCDGSLNS